MNHGITTLQGLPGSAAVSGPSSSASKAEVSSDPAVEKTDQASLSAVSDLVSRALSKTEPTSEVRLDKVLPLQQAIANGTYHVAASDVAGKIVDSLLS